MGTRLALFELDGTYYGSTNTIDTSDYGVSVGVEGEVREFKDKDPSDDTKVRSQVPITAIAVRNVSGITLLPGLAVTWAAGYEGRRVDGYSCVTAAEIAGIVSDRLSTTGVRNGDIFWLIVKGPCLVHTPVAGANFGETTWAAGDFLHAITAAASTATTTGGSTANEAGRLQSWRFTATSTGTTDGSALKKLANQCGWAMSAATSGETSGNTLKLVQVNVKRYA